MTTPFRLTPDVIRKVVPEDKVGVYALGDVENGEFTIKYVGRSDSSLQKRLLTHNYLYRFSYFIFCCTDNEKEAFEMESRWWHICNNEHVILCNHIHPDAPSGVSISCPYCSAAREIKNYFKAS